MADQVRIAQKQWGFDDVTAHKMAILAIEQYGLMLNRIETDLAVVHSLTDITPDSIAAWLAIKINATSSLSVKHQAVEINKKIESG